MDIRFLEQLDHLSEEDLMELIMKQPAMQVLKSIEEMPDEVILEGIEAMIQYFRNYSQNYSTASQLDVKIKKQLLQAKK